MNLRLRGIGVALAALGCSIAFSFPAKAQQPGGDLAPPPPPPDEEDEGEPAGPQAAEEPVPAPDSGPPARYTYPRRWPGWVVVPSRAFLRPLRRHVVPWASAAPIVRVARPAPSIGRAPMRGTFYGPPRGVVVRARPAPPVRVTPHRRR